MPSASDKMPFESRKFSWNVAHGSPGASSLVHQVSREILSSGGLTPKGHIVSPLPTSMPTIACFEGLVALFSMDTKSLSPQPLAANSVAGLSLL